ncbi:MAG: HAMP domain-containing histidine kinase [Clostridia bacterium]|nr:HAMP domain-containing histidine kinase [Clostridia bacterium]
MVLSAELVDIRDANSYLRFTVSDNGNGISEEVKQKMFNPFFTTKKAGQGTGLGLHISMEIIKEHGGQILCQTHKGQFCKFMVDLPL